MRRIIGILMVVTFFVTLYIVACTQMAVLRATTIFGAAAITFIWLLIASWMISK